LISLFKHLKRWAAVYSLLLTAVAGIAGAIAYFNAPNPSIKLLVDRATSVVFDESSIILKTKDISQYSALYRSSFAYRNDGNTIVDSFKDSRLTSNVKSILAISYESEFIDKNDVGVKVSGDRINISVRYLKPDEEIKFTILSKQKNDVSKSFRLRNAQTTATTWDDEINRYAYFGFASLGTLFLIQVWLAYGMLTGRVIIKFGTGKT
jgi:hypothetical protein